MKRITAIILLLCLLLTLVPLGAAATETTAPTQAEEVLLREPGKCGDDMTWSYDAGTLTISGSGSMDDYPDGDAPWLIHKDNITRVVFSGNISYIGEGAFTDYDAIETVDFGPAMHTIGVRAFKSCDGLTSITLPGTFRRFGEECFMSCKSLTEIRCLGGMPSFNGNCVWDTYCTIFYPANNPWPVEPVTQLYHAFQGRINFFMGESTPVEIAQPTTAPTEAPTVPETTVPPTTEAPTVPETTAAPTEAPTVPETTETVTEPVAQPQPQETEPEPEPEKGLGINGIWFGLFLITGTLSLVLIGALIFRRRSY